MGKREVDKKVGQEREEVLGKEVRFSWVERICRMDWLKPLPAETDDN